MYRSGAASGRAGTGRKAIARVVNEYAKQMKDGRRMLLVLVTDESGDDGQNVEEADFAWATRAIVSVANRHAKDRVVSSLEGGYHLEALGRSALAHVRALAEG